MYLWGERSDPAKRCSAENVESCGICHLTQQEPEADGAQLGRSADCFFSLVVVASGADTGLETFSLAGLAASACLGRGRGAQVSGQSSTWPPSLGHKGSHVMRGSPRKHSHLAALGWLGYGPLEMTRCIGHLTWGQNTGCGGWRGLWWLFA